MDYKSGRIRQLNLIYIKETQMKKLVYTGIGLILFIISGCNVSKDIATPDPALPASFRGTEKFDSSGIAAIQWRQFFTDTTLQTIIDSALAHNFDLQVAVKNIEAAKLIVSQAKLGYFPEAKLQAAAAINRPSDNSLNGLSLSQFLGKSYIEDYSLSAMLSWEADIWGKIKNQRKKAASSFLQTNEAKNAIQTNLISLIATGYYNLTMLDTQVSIAQKNLLLGDSTVEIIRHQYNAGQVTDLAIQQAEAQRLVAAQLIPFIQQQIEIQENALSVLAGAIPSSINRNGQLNESIVANELSTGVPASLLQNRPDIRAVELQLAIANANTGIAKANMYPTLSITAAGGINSFKASNWFSMPASLFGMAAGGIVQPLFQRKQLKTQYELAKVEREKVVIQFRQSVLGAVGEVSNAQVKINKLKEQETIAQNRVGILQKAITNADLLFKNGMATYLEVITAQSNVLQAELELTSLKKDRVIAAIELYRSLGGGWK